MIYGLHAVPKLHRREKTVIRKGNIVRYMTWVDQLGQEYELKNGKWTLKPGKWPATLVEYDQHHHLHHHHHPMLEHHGSSSTILLHEVDYLILFLVCLWIIIWVIGLIKKSSDGNRGSTYDFSAAPHESCPCQYYHYVTRGQA
jgi:hypothetical protein